jgi:hypothetical protein
MLDPRAHRNCLIKIHTFDISDLAADLFSLEYDSARLSPNYAANVRVSRKRSKSTCGIGTTSCFEEDVQEKVVGQSC